jgi:hypothetical protein
LLHGSTLNEIAIQQYLFHRLINVKRQTGILRLEVNHLYAAHNYRKINGLEYPIANYLAR